MLHHKVDSHPSPNLTKAGLGRATETVSNGLQRHHFNQLHNSSMDSNKRRHIRSTHRGLDIGLIRLLDRGSPRRYNKAHPRPKLTSRSGQQKYLGQSMRNPPGVTHTKTHFTPKALPSMGTTSPFDHPHQDHHMSMSTVTPKTKIDLLLSQVQQLLLQVNQSMQMGTEGLADGSIPTSIMGTMGQPSIHIPSQTVSPSQNPTSSAQGLANLDLLSKLMHYQLGSNNG